MKIERRVIQRGIPVGDWKEDADPSMVTYLVMSLLALSSTKQVTIHRERYAVEYRRMRQTWTAMWPANTYRTCGLIRA